MSEQNTILKFYEQDHERLDELFKNYQNLKRSDFAQAKEVFEQFKICLQRHIAWEEDLLFPLWEDKTGMSEAGPTLVMRAEHRQIGQQLEAIHDKVVGQNPDSDQEVQALLNILGAHNMKEERILYPAIDQVIDEQERELLFQHMAEIPEERYKVCCGHEPV